MQRLASLFSFAALATLATAQSTLVIPNGTATAEGSGGNAFPWGRGPNGIRIQNLYDGANFTNQGVTAPIVVSRLRWRPNTNTSSLATSYATGATVKLSTSPVDQAAISTTLSNNQGSDLTTVFNGPVSWPAVAATAGPCPFLIDIPLSSPFYYDPARGDLNIETDLPIQTFTGTMLQIDHHNTVASPASRAFVTTGYTNNGANDVGSVNLNTGAVVEVTYTAATGIHSRFTANVTRGPSPLSVTFTDQSWTSAPGGVTSWAWDFNGDSIIDSTLQNPTFVYSTCGDFPVTLTVDDGVNGPVTWTAPNFIRTDEIVADFTFAQLIAPDTWQFTDTTTPAANTWLWDFNGDNIVDSTLQNPTWVMPVCQLSNVRLDAMLNCRSSTKTRPVYAAPATLPTTLASTGQALSGQGFFFDLTVSHPQGINLWALDSVLGSSPTSFTANLHVTPGSYLGNDTNASVWRLAGTATGTFAGASGPSLAQFASPVHLPAGSYGAALYFSASTFARFQGTPPVTTFGNPDFTFTNGPMRSTLFGGSVLLSRLWPGAIHYDTASLAATAGYGFFGAGCPGALGITHLQNGNRPQLGTTLSVNLDNLPLAAAIMMVGFSKTLSQSGPLPLDLGSFGAPGCFARVSPDATQFLLGTGTTATWTFGVPNDAGFLGMPLFHQALVLDQPASNTLGAVVSDAAGMLIGH